jgi:uncharacterized protein (UPF0212 family)
MSEKKPTPIVVEPDSKKCPICGKPSYSRGGIHPQCAVTQADSPRKIQLAAQKKALAVTKAETDQSKLDAADKDCPECNMRVPAARETCHCGHEFDEE